MKILSSNSGKQNKIRTNTLTEHGKRSVYIYSNGCVPNRLTSNRLMSILQKNGYEISISPENTEVIIFNSCGYCGDRINETKKMIESILDKKNKNASLIVTGCIEKIAPEVTREYPACEFIEINNILIRLSVKKKFDDLYISNCIIDNLETTKENIFNVMTSKGCLGQCSYCAIKKARGSIKSKPIEQIVNEIEKGLEIGFKKIVLWGDDFGAYGMDINTSYIKLLKAVINSVSQNIEYELFLHRLNPQWIINSLEELYEILAQKKIRMIYSPVQSGSDRLLKLMNRRYVTKDVIDSFCGLKSADPQVIIKSDIMVGFPTENDADVEATIKMIESVPFDEIVLFKYSGINGTTAFSMDDHISEDEKCQRINGMWKALPFLRYMIEKENGKYWVIDKKDNIKILASPNKYMENIDVKGVLK